MGKGETVPEIREMTVRQALLELLAGRELPVSLLSKEVHKPEKEVYEHLQELHKAGAVAMISAECVKCGFVFAERQKTKKPGKCPKCKSTRIEPPRFTAMGELEEDGTSDC